LRATTSCGNTHVFTSEPLIKCTTVA